MLSLDLSLDLNVNNAKDKKQKKKKPKAKKQKHWYEDDSYYLMQFVLVSRDLVYIPMQLIKPLYYARVDVRNSFVSFVTYSVQT